MRHTSDAMHIDHIALAIVRDEGQIVLVQQHTPEEHRPFWVVPGGLVEAGELVIDALVREVNEETGVRVTEVRGVAAISQIDRPAHTCQTLAFIFDVTQWQGTLHSEDPHGEVSEVERVPQAEAISRLERNGGWKGIHEPLLAYLRGEVAAGTLWFYREDASGQHLLGKLPPAS